MIEVSENLRDLRDRVFVAEGYDIRFVGGAVRDDLLGIMPKDLDLCTDAPPEKQIELYQRHGVSYHETGLAHGTLTVVLGRGEVYEITSLRSDEETDGRHASVRYGVDWETDQGRRDLTINSMARDFDGVIYDPFNGQTDLAQRVVRFVGDPDARMREDYLRILRWIRFHGRIAPGVTLDPETCEAAMRNAKGLGPERISRERVWSEVQRIVAGHEGPRMMREMMRMDLCYPCGLPHGSWRDMQRVHALTRHPVTLMVAFLTDPTRVSKLAERWKWSRAESVMATFLAQNLADYTIDYQSLLAVERIDLGWVLELAYLQEREPEAKLLRHWDIPVYPIKGADLVSTGVRPGVEIGKLLEAGKMLWADSNYTMTREELLAALRRTA